jgi:hypothetical protein
MEPELSMLMEYLDRGHALVLVDYFTNADESNEATPLSHASLIQKRLVQLWEERHPCGTATAGASAAPGASTAKHADAVLDRGSGGGSPGAGGGGSDGGSGPGHRVGRVGRLGRQRLYGAGVEPGAARTSLSARALLSSASRLPCEIPASKKRPRGQPSAVGHTVSVAATKMAPTTPDTALGAGTDCLRDEFEFGQDEGEMEDEGEYDEGPRMPPARRARPGPGL